jgi:hypothetical protein
MQYLSCWGLNRCVHDAATGTGFYSHQGIVVDKVIESNLLIGHKHGKEITWFKNLSSIYYGRELSHICGYTRELGLTFNRNEILHFFGYWKTILFPWLRETLILVDHQTHCVGNIISLSFDAYKERPNRRAYASCALIWRQGGPGLRIENKYGK